MESLAILARLEKLERRIEELSQLPLRFEFVGHGP